MKTALNKIVITAILTPALILLPVSPALAVTTLAPDPLLSASTKACQHLLLLRSTDRDTIATHLATMDSNFVLQKADYISGINYIRLTVGTRYIGRITFQDGVNTLWNNYVGQQINYNLPFASSTVRSINPASGLFSFAGLYGAVIVAAGSEDSTLFFDTDHRFITFNAVGNYKLPASVDFQALKLVNRVAPLNNNIFVSSGDVVQISGNGTGSLNITLVGSQPLSNVQKVVNTPGF